jgi:Sec-independent protein translocase protein TatA
MPAKTKTTKKTTKRKSAPKKEQELKLEEGPVPEPTPVSAPVVPVAPVAPVTPAVPVEEQSTVNHFESRLDGLLKHLTSVMKIIKELNNEVKDVKKELTRELKKRDKSKKKKRSSSNRPPSGFAKPTQLSPELCVFMNIEKDSLKARTEVTKFFCEYFKEHDLQDPAYRRNIIPNAALKKILKLTNEDQVSYFNLQKYLKIHYPKSKSTSD